MITRLLPDILDIGIKDVFLLILLDQDLLSYRNLVAATRII